MTTPTRFDQMAAEVLPCCAPYACTFGHERMDGTRLKIHNSTTCPAHHREALAAQLERVVRECAEVAESQRDALQRRVEHLEKHGCYPRNESTTHYPDCWKTRRHHECAIKRVEEMEEGLREIAECGTTMVPVEWNDARVWRERFLSDDEPPPPLEAQQVCYLVADCEKYREVAEAVLSLLTPSRADPAP